MDWSNVYTIVAILAFWWICDWAAPVSRLKQWTLLFGGLMLLIIGINSGFKVGQEKAARDAQQAAILTSPEMPR